jgi:hypothetical protein
MGGAILSYIISRRGKEQLNFTVFRKTEALQGKLLFSVFFLGFNELRQNYT